MIVHKDDQVSLAPLESKTVAILGYGNQGRPQALNLKDSGIKVIIGARANSSKRAQAEADEFEVFSFAEALAKADVVMMLLPDDVMAKIYDTDIAPHLRPGTYLGFGHGMAIHAGWVKPNPNLNVFLLAPKAQGRGVRNKYLLGSGVPGLVGIHQDPSGNTKSVALAYGKAIGCSRAGIIETTFAQETVSDLFSEQSVLCGGLTQIIKTAFEVLVEAGFDPEVAYFECLYEVKLIADLLQEGGISFMRDKISSTALFGDLTRGDRVIDTHLKDNMQRVLAEIQSGQFASEFLAEVQSGRPRMRERYEQDYHHPIEETGRRLREAQVL